VLDVKSPAPLGEAFVLRSPKPRRTKSSKATSVHQDSDIEYDDAHVLDGPDVEVEEPTIDPPTSESPQPESPVQAQPDRSFLNEDPSAATLDDRPRKRSLHRQMTLHEVLLNLQDPSSRPRRIDRIMQGLSPETPINSVLPDRSATSTTTSERPAPFQGDGDRKSRAFRDHLSSLMAKRSAQLSDPDWEKNQGRLKRLEEVPGSAPATRTQFGLGAVQRQQTLPPLPESAPGMRMFEVSPDGVPAFTRPKRPGHRKRTGGGKGTPATSGSTHGAPHFVPTPTRGSPPPTPSPVLRESPPPLPPSASETYLPPSAPPSQLAFSPVQVASPQLSPQVVEEQPKLSPPPPTTPQKRRRRRPSAEQDGPARLGSVTGTPVHDSPEDFRGMKERKKFSPLEDDDAQAAMSVVGVYEGEAESVVVERERSRTAPLQDTDERTEFEAPATSSPEELEPPATPGSDAGSSVSKDRGESIGLGRPPPAYRRKTSKSSRSNASSGPSTEHTVRNVSKPAPVRALSTTQSSKGSVGQTQERTETMLLVAPEDGIPYGDSRDFTPRVNRAAPSVEDGITPKAKGSGSHSRGNSAEMVSEEDTAPPAPKLLPAAELPTSPRFQPRPLRLSRLFEQAHNTATQSLPEPLPSHPGTATPGSVRSRRGRRPLSAIFMAEDEETIDNNMPNSARIDFTQVPPSPTPRRPHEQVTSPFQVVQPPAFSHTPPGSAGYPFTSTPQTSSSNRIRSDSVTEEPISRPSPFVFPASRHHQGLSDIPLPSPASSIRSRQSRTAHLPYHHNAGFAPNHKPRSSATTPVTSSTVKAPSSLQPSQLSGRHSRHLSVESAVSAASSAASSVAKPLLFFAIASDDVKEVERLLSSGEANANDRAGPDDLPALLFTMGNEG
ncbi:hypothetical protein FRC01_010133, partial [Tulasnella sp. 417]